MSHPRIEEAKTYLEELAADIELMNEDPREVMEYMVALGRKTSTLDPALRTEERMVPGCTSNVWVYAELTGDGELSFVLHAEAFIVKGYCYVLHTAFDGWPVESFLSEESDALLLRFLERTQLGLGTLASRTNSVRSIFLEMKKQAQELVEAS